MSDLFLKTLQDEFAKKPNLKKLSEATVKAIAEAFEGWKEIAAYEPSELVEVFADTETKLTLLQANAIVALAKSESAGGDEVNVKMQAVVDEPAVANPYLNLLTGASSIGLSDDAIMASRLKPEFLERGAQAVEAFIVLSQGADDLFTDKFFRELQIEDLEAADAAYQWAKDKANGKWVRESDLDNMFKAMPDFFGPRWKKVMETASKLSSARSAQTMLQGGTYQLNADSGDFAALGTLVPAVAEHLSNQLVASKIPSVAKDAIAMVQELMKVLRMPGIQRAAGVVEDDADVGVIKFLIKRLGAQTANVFRLAVVAGRLVRAIGVCPQIVDAQYLQVFGTLASQYNVLYSLVVGDEEVAMKPDAGFRTVQSVATPEPRRRWTFSLSLEWKRG